MELNFKYAEEYAVISESEQRKLNQIQEMMEKKEAMLDWLDIDTSVSMKDLQKMDELTQKIRNSADVFIVTGIGGSYLGSKAVIDCFSPYFSKRKPEIIYVGYHLSASYLQDIMTYIEGKSVYLNVISKSGTTLETLVSFQKLYQFIKENYVDYRERVIITTDITKGKLRKFAEEERLETFSIPREIGGRYSIFSPAGLFPISVMGVDIHQLLKGARSERNCFQKSGHYALTRKHLEDAGKVVEALTFYEEKFTSLALWIQQLFAETQGKQRKGILPIINPNTTNLHSLGQYLQEGRKIVFETVLRVKMADDLPLKGYHLTMGQLNELVADQVSVAHSQEDTPNIIISLDSLNEFEIGKILYFFEVAAAIGGYLLEINPFNQPGVETYKKLVNEYLS